MKNTTGKPLWRCPKCGLYRISEHFIGKPPMLWQTFKGYVELARDCGPIIVYAQKTRIVIQARVRFAGAVIRCDWLDATMWLKRRVHHPCLERVESFGTLGYGHHHHFHLKHPGDLDKSLAE